MFFAKTPPSNPKKAQRESGEVHYGLRLGGGGHKLFFYGGGEHTFLEKKELDVI